MSNNSEITITNSIVWNTIDLDSQMEDDGQINITHSDIQGGWEGRETLILTHCFVIQKLIITFLQEIPL